MRCILQAKLDALHGFDLSSGKPCPAVKLSDGVRRLSHPANPHLRCLVVGHRLDLAAASPPPIQDAQCGRVGERCQRGSGRRESADQKCLSVESLEE